MTKSFTALDLRVREFPQAPAESHTHHTVFLPAMKTLLITVTATLVCADREEYGRLEGELLPGMKKMRNYLIRTVLRGGTTTDGTPLAGG